jgi:methylase of polypeptide subunit release factors
LFSILIRNIRKLKQGLFLDIGSGTGIYAHQLLKMGGWSGKATDSNIDALAVNHRINSEYVTNKSYEVIEQDIFTYIATCKDKFDLV